ncbi:hypothetical protein BC567DRAFT_209778 [Phyllosticta citribraziliensis]
MQCSAVAAAACLCLLLVCLLVPPPPPPPHAYIAIPLPCRAAAPAAQCPQCGQACATPVASVVVDAHHVVSHITQTNMRRVHKMQQQAGLGSGERRSGRMGPGTYAPEAKKGAWLVR